MGVGGLTGCVGEGREGPVRGVAGGLQGGQEAGVQGR